MSAMPYSSEISYTEREIALQFISIVCAKDLQIVLLMVGCLQWRVSSSFHQELSCFLCSSLTNLTRNDQASKSRPKRLNRKHTN